MASRPVPKLLSAGSHAPDFHLPRLGGREDALRDLLARGPVLLAFFKVSCPVCQLAFPFLERLHTGGTLRVFGISQNDEPETLEFNRQFGITFPILLDSEEDRFPTSNAYGISSVPTLFLVAPDATVTRVIEGWQKKAMEWLGGLAGVSPFRPAEFVPELKAG
jgi:peroxiredoxin